MKIKEIVMNRILYVFLISLLFSSTAKSQDLVDLNLIIVVNEEVKPSSISVKLKYTSKDGNIKDVDVTYIPGSLKIKKESFDELKRDSIENVILEIRNTTICKEDVSYSFFKIDDLRFSLLEYNFFILHIYDTKLKQYKSIYEPIINKDFTYEYDSPVGSMRRVQKKKTNKQKYCK